ncbi:glycoside hydrolase family 99-like domain-containing protein [Arcticibacter eurypsychrophilus]|uniref:glycoside hydrolase family 99-like domain-containing protein n=1 Tax=Arcticibacter eurypsychrophilus TaxID=1434752 RepID=UPI00084CFC03|nr:glycoside hydrolase family 99-like domain-containing protein [Arcticibacter eurypsychrophilus]
MNFSLVLFIYWSQPLFIQKTKLLNIKLTIIFVFSLIFNSSYSQEKRAIIGAYYFDGWTGVYPYHITDVLTRSFPERESKWGWITSTQQKVDRQIIEAYNSGLSFFSFCWYFTGKNSYKTEPLNRALSFYTSSSQKDKLKYCLLVANHGGFTIGPSEWSTVVSEWISNFKSKEYLTIDGEPMLVFFSLEGLVERFGSAEKVKIAFESLKTIAKSKGLKGVCLAVCVTPEKERMDLAKKCGFDVLTGYNYHSSALVKGNKKVPIGNLQISEMHIWNQIADYSDLRYIPVCTINWDPRPWANSSNGYSTAPYYEGFSSSSVTFSIRGCINWLEERTKTQKDEKVAFVYAWNEYGEGAWLTPGRMGFKPLKNVKKEIYRYKK